MEDIKLKVFNMIKGNKTKQNSAKQYIKQNSTKTIPPYCSFLKKFKKGTDEGIRMV